MYKKTENVNSKTIKGKSYKEMIKHKSQFLKMNTGIDTDSLESIQKFMYYNVKDITTSQLRNIYNTRYYFYLYRNNRINLRFIIF